MLERLRGVSFRVHKSEKTPAAADHDEGELTLDSTSEDEALTVDTFDFDAFFDEEEAGSDDVLETSNPDLINLKETLAAESEQIVSTFTTKVSRDTFEKSSQYVSGVASVFSGLIGSCGPLCMHGLAGAMQAPVSGLSASGVPGLSFDGNGGFSLSGDVDSLSRATGFSRGDLLSGKYSAEQVLAALFDSFGEGFGMLFGFGLINSLADMFFDSFMPSTAAA